ncbi:site-2 protease family protein [Desulfovibrio litoralis]|uniref:Zn-dependent protease (Includes SpoIVFB) n=1 Tax=Desulfovibrio litoralis DSM 11393 TaxID=1121455 RepID=A0A1M7SM78_9BACT|nr:site-2 protease family protein [Desulfovibrio litoralis]SHN59577.1 Zn-dependent protease (includes SpoIVFB) [Desulfovibrio litoralis DSM 11393]
MDFNINIERILLMIFPMLVGTILHELAHAFAAYKLGDPTAKHYGRLTLNPIAHLDKAGSLVFIVTALFAPFAFGWAKPVPIDPRYFKNRRLDEIIVSVAGPLTNFLVAFAFFIFLVLSGGKLSFDNNEHWYQNMLSFGVVVNITLGWFNLFPLPPLDGSHILANILPRNLAIEYEKLAGYSMIILMLLLITDVFSAIMRPLIFSTIDVFEVLISYIL